MSASVHTELARARALTAELIELVAVLRARPESVPAADIRVSRGSADESVGSDDPQVAKPGGRLPDGELRTAFAAALDARPRRPRTLLA